MLFRSVYFSLLHSNLFTSFYNIFSFFRFLLFHDLAIIFVFTVLCFVRRRITFFFYTGICHLSISQFNLNKFFFYCFHSFLCNNFEVMTIQFTITAILFVQYVYFVYLQILIGKFHKKCHRSRQIYLKIR